MAKVEEIVTDEQIEKAWGYANFGAIGKRELIRSTLLKCACGYQSGRTANCIVVELGLMIQGRTELTKLGQEYLWAAYSRDSNIETKY